MSIFYATFGVGMAYRKRYVKLIAENESKARDMMHAAHGAMWCVIYTEDRFKGQKEKYGYTELSTLTSNDPFVDWDL